MKRERDRPPGERRLIACLLALAGAHPRAVPALAALVPALSPTDWAGILALARATQLAAVLDAHLRQQRLQGALPPAIRTALDTERRQTLTAFGQQVAALGRLAAALRHAGIPYRLLKGLALAAQVYPVPTARAVGDIDLWVRPPDLLRTMEILRALGLVPRAANSPWSLPFRQVFAEEQEFAPGTNGGLPAGVDLHWHLVAPWWLRAGLRIPEAAIFARAIPVAIAEQSYSTLEPTDNFYYLCLHAGINHQFQGLRWLVDLALLAETGWVDWRRLARLGAESSTTAILWRGCDLLDQTFGCRYSSRLAARPASLRRCLLRAMLPPTLVEHPGAPASASDLRVPVEHLVLLPDLPATVAAMGRLLWPPAAWLRLRYGPAPGLLRARLYHLARLRHLFRRVTGNH